MGIKGTGSNMLRMIFIVLDLLFVGAFIVVAVLTSPKRGGSSAPCNLPDTLLSTRRFLAQLQLALGNFHLGNPQHSSTCRHCCLPCHQGQAPHEDSQHSRSQGDRPPRYHHWSPEW